MKISSLRFWLANGIALFCLLDSNPTLAQILPDATLPSNTSISNEGNTSIISGGTQAGNNLFHSFEQFSIPTGWVAEFKNAPDIQNIISRVTGSSVSSIDGLIRANGTANLFLINPNGIIFGSNAKLDIKGSFLASTASSLKFTDGTFFSATTPQITPLLTVSVPVGLQFGSNVGRIHVQGNGEGIRKTNELIDTPIGPRVEPTQTLALVGGEMELEGGTLKTAGGRIELGSVAGSSLVNLSPTDKGWALGYEDVSTFRDIQLSGAAAVDASGAGGGDVQVRGRQVTLQNGSQIEASTLGAQPGGTLNVTASDLVELSGSSADGQSLSILGTQVYQEATGAGGSLTLETGRLIVRDGAIVSVDTFGVGSSGTLVVNAKDSVELIGTAVYDDYPSSLSTSVQPEARGAGGNLTVETGKLIVRDGAQIQAATYGVGSSGSLTVNASDSVELIGTSAKDIISNLFTTAQPEATGAGGDLTVRTRRLVVRDGAQIQAATFNNKPAGNLLVIASESVELIGTTADGSDSSGLFTSVQQEASGAGGNLTVETGRLIVRDGARVNAGTFGDGLGGTLWVRASESVQLIGKSADGQLQSGLFTATEGVGNAGNLRVETKELNVQDGAEVSVSSVGSGSGKAGDLEIITRFIRLDNQGKLTATTDSGNGGNITLQAQDLLLMRRNSQISTTAGTVGTNGNGGNININNTKFIVAAENSDIKANAFLGQGGKVTIKAQSIYGLAVRNLKDLQTLLETKDPTKLDPINLPSSDITAISQTDPLLSGQVIVDVLDVDPSRGLATLPVELVDASRQIVQGCLGVGGNLGRGASEFIITGRGGLPDNPSETLNSAAVWVDLSTPYSTQENRPSSNVSTNPTSFTADPIVEASGWVFNDKGEVVLTASTPTYSSWLTPHNCRAPNSVSKH